MRFILLALLLLTSPACAQWQVPANELPVGRGPAVRGFDSSTDTDILPSVAITRPLDTRFNTGVPSFVYIMNASDPQSINLQLFTEGTNTWSGDGSTLRIDHIAPAGTTYVSSAIIVSMSSLGGAQTAYNMTTACGAGNNCITGYLEARDFVDATTAQAANTALELNLNTHSDPSKNLALNIVHQSQAGCPGAGCVDGGMGIQVGGDVVGWGLHLKLAQFTVQPLFFFDSAVFAGFDGAWLTYNTPNLEFHKMTGGTREGTSGNGIPDVTTYTVPLLLANTGGVQIGGAGTTNPAGTTVLNVADGQLGFRKITNPAAAVGASGGSIFLVCGTNAGTAKLVAVAGTSATLSTVVDNIGAGVTGC